MVVLAGVLGLGLGTLIGFFKEYVENSDQDYQEKMSKAKSFIIKNIPDFILKKLLKR